MAAQPMQLFAPDNPRPLHFMGIGGAGMSALALIARRRGVTVTGCDLEPRGAADLVRAGVRVCSGHDASHVADARAVVHTAAVPASHPELEAARGAGIPVVRRADALQQVVEPGAVIGVAGTHGKTTTTAMATEALAAAGADPTGIAGGRVTGWDGNVRFGGDALFVVEADEYDKAFLALRPTFAVVNNVEADHLECYGSLAALEAAFADFASRAEGVLVGWDDPGARRVADSLAGPIWRVGMAEDSDIRLRDIRPDRERSAALLTLPDGRVQAVELLVPGVHNLRNAAMALGTVFAMGHDVERATKALATFKGVGRRFEVLGSSCGVTVVDDYAHHPTEVAATIAAARQRFPTARVVAVFQPHLYSRTQMHGEALGASLGAADIAVIAAIYPAREEPIPGVSGAMVADAARRAGVHAEWVPQRQELVKRIVDVVQDGDVVLILGAGDITEIGPDLLGRLPRTPA